MSTTPNTATVSEPHVTVALTEHCEDACRDDINLAERRERVADICMEIASRPENQHNLEYTDLYKNFYMVLDAVDAAQPELLPDLFTIVEKANEDDCVRIFSMLSKGIAIGPKVLHRISSPAIKVLGEKITGENKQEVLRAAQRFGTDLGNAFKKTYLQSVSAFAGILENPNDGISYDLFQNSKNKMRTLSYTSVDDAMYALELTNYALFRAFTSHGVDHIETINPYGEGSKEVTLGNGMFSRHEDDNVKIYIRPSGEENRIGHLEFGKGRHVDGSISIRIPISPKYDRRQQKAVDDPIEYDRRTALHELQDKYLMQTSDNELSIRIDYEKRSMSLDLGGISNDMRGISFVIGKLFTVGNMRLAEKMGVEPTLNHHVLKEYSDPKLFAFMARCALLALTTTAISSH